MKVLDLFCGQGGAGMGYAQAGHDILGVDLVSQPRYQFSFVRDEALSYLRKHGGDYDFIHASPPCQAYSHLTPKANKGSHKKLIAELRETLLAIGKPYVIENVYGAKSELINPVMLCGSMFGLRTRRHRYFETSFYFSAPKVCDHSELPLLVTTASKASRSKRFKLGISPKSVRNAPLAYGISWMTFSGLKEAIPPAYTKYIINAYTNLNQASKGFAPDVHQLSQNDHRVL